MLCASSWRSWNDLKTCLKKAGLLRTMLQYSLVYNLNYGPAGSKAWHARTEALAKEYWLSGSAHEDLFISYIPHISEERGVAEPSTARSEKNFLMRVNPKA